MKTIHNLPWLKALMVLTIAWGLLTVFDIGHRSSAGYTTDGNNTVIHVEPGGPAERAGIRVKDYITAVNGVPSEDAAGLARLGRAQAGDMRQLTIRRGITYLQLELVPEPLPAHSRNVAWLSILTGAIFLGFCNMAWLRHPGRATCVLAIMGSGFSLIFLDGTRFDWLPLQALATVVRSGLVLIAFAAMLHFLLIFPKPGAFAARDRNIRLLYLPAIMFWLLLSFRTLVRPDSSTALNTITYSLTGLVIAGYCLVSVIVFLRRFLKTPRSDRKHQGTHLILWGSILGFLPAMLSYTPVLAAVPGSQYFFASLALVPMSWFLAVHRFSVARLKAGVDPH